MSAINVFSNYAILLNYSIACVGFFVEELFKSFGTSDFVFFHCDKIQSHYYIDIQQT